jgi:MFS superfamily sulfate permease-like transporter
MFFTDALYSLPTAALGGILVAAAWSLCDFDEFRRIWRFRGLGLVGAILTMAGVVGIGVLEGIGIGVAYSLVLVLRTLAFPDDAVLGRLESGEFRDREGHPEGATFPGVLVYRFAAPLFFANCGRFRDRLEGLIESSPEPLRAVVVDASAFFDVDLAACEVLAALHQELHARGIRLALANLRGSVKERMFRGWDAAATAKGLFYPTLDAAIDELRN